MARAKISRRRVTKSARAGLTFPMTRVRNMLKSTLGKSRRIGWGAAAYATAVMEYLAAEVLEIAGHVCKDFKQRRISPRHMLFAILNDSELATLLSKVTLPGAGVLPVIQPALLPAAKRSAIAATATTTQTKTVGRVAKKTKAVARAPAPKATKATKASAKTTAAKRKHQGITILDERVLSNGQKLTIISGDIVNVKCDAIVNPSSSNYSLGGQVGSRLSQVGGAAFQQKVKNMKGSIATGEAAICEGVNFAADYVIHCNGPSWGGNNAGQSITQLEKTVSNCFELADDEELSSICFPSIGSGVGNFPKQTAAQTILRAIAAFFRQRPNCGIKQVYFDLYDQESIDVYVTELARMKE